MTRFDVAIAADLLWLAAGALCLTCAARLATVVALAPREATSRTVPWLEGRPRSSREALDGELARLLASAVGSAGGPAPSAVPSVIRPGLVVNPPTEGRAAVYVDGVRVGLTPYIGEVNCREGAVVKVELLLPDGGIARYRGMCQGKLLRLVEPGNE